MMSKNIQDTHGLLDEKERALVKFELRQVSALRSREMNDEDYDAAVALLQFIDAKQDHSALSGEIISFLGLTPYGLSRRRIEELLKYLIAKNFIFVGGTITRRHVLGNLPIQLSSWREHKNATIQ